MAFLVTSIVLLLAGDPVVAVWTPAADRSAPRLVVAIINGASVYYLSAIAVAIGFRMNLFNIGVDGQYRVAAFAAAVFAGQGWLPGPLNIIVSLLIAMVAGALWAGIAGWLKVTRGVSEVISTIMLNAIATGLVSYLLSKVADSTAGSNVTNTRAIPESSARARVRTDPRDAQQGLRLHPARSAGRCRLLAGPEQDTLRVRPACHRPVRDGGRGQRCQRQGAWC